MHLDGEQLVYLSEEKISKEGNLTANKSKISKEYWEANI